MRWLSHVRTPCPLCLSEVSEVRKTADRDGTKTGIEIRLACEPNGSDGCRRESLLHPLGLTSVRRHNDPGSGSIGPVLPLSKPEPYRHRRPSAGGMAKPSTGVVRPSVLCARKGVRVSSVLGDMEHKIGDFPVDNRKIPDFVLHVTQDPRPSTLIATGTVPLFSHRLFVIYIYHFAVCCRLPAQSLPPKRRSAIHKSPSQSLGARGNSTCCNATYSGSTRGEFSQVTPTAPRRGLYLRSCHASVPPASPPTAHVPEPEYSLTLEEIDVQITGSGIV
jgi:hypothetical protein